jgi:ketosteroid isomerase-like protein
MTAAPRVTATEQERAAGIRYTKALASPGLTQLGPALDDEAHFRFVTSKDVNGREKVVSAHLGLFGGFDGRNFVTNRVLLTDNSQALEWTMTGVQRGTRTPVTIKGVTLLWTKDDGTISDIHLYFDEAVVQAQLGKGPDALRNFRPTPGPTPTFQLIDQERSDTEKANTDLVRTQLQALEDNKEAAYLATMSEDITIHTLESTEPSRGKAAPRNYFTAMRSAIAYLATSIENIWGVGPYVAVEYHIVGEQRRPIGWVLPQKDKLIKLSMVDIMQIRDGKIARVWRYDNPIQIMSSP